MVKIDFTKQFFKHYRQRILPNQGLDAKFQQRLILFRRSRTDQELHDHKLTGDKKDYRSFSVSGDIRVIYKIDGEFITFYDIGSHNQVY